MIRILPAIIPAGKDFGLARRLCGGLLILDFNHGSSRLNRSIHFVLDFGLARRFIRRSCGGLCGGLRVLDL